MNKLHQKKQLDRLRLLFESAVAEIVQRADEIAMSNARGRPPANSDYEPKIETKVRIDADVVDWIKSLGPRHYSRINGLLRALMEAHKRSEPLSNKGD